MAASVEQFGKALTASGLFTADELRTLWAALPADARPKTGDALSQWLVEQGKLTQFQAEELLAGRGSSLLMGDYVLVEELGAGGMGKVYKARHRTMQRIVALKVMSSAAMQDESAVKRFQREVRAAAKLEHPNIVTAYDSGTAAKVRYLVMQFVDGGDLASLVRHHGVLDVERAVEYVCQAAQGLAYAHGEGVVHRDIKPANLLLDKRGVVKILDMGLARIDDSTSSDGLTGTEQVMGTVDYMSPEQAADTKHVDARTDVYSLGCTLWYLLTGKRMFDGDTAIKRLMKHRDQPRPSLVKARDDVTWPLEQVFHKMVAVEPQNRYQSMDEVLEALEPHRPSRTGISPTGMGSSLGMGGGPRDAELSAFLRTVGPAGTQTGAASKSPATAADAPTAMHAPAQVETDPKSELLAPSSTPVTRDAQRSGKPAADGPPLKLIAAGVGVCAVLFIGTLAYFLSRGGDEAALAPGERTGGSAIAASSTLGVSPGAKKVAPPPTMVPKTPPADDGLSMYERLTSSLYDWTDPEPIGPPLDKLGAGTAEKKATQMTVTTDGLRLYLTDVPAGTEKERMVQLRRPAANASWGPMASFPLPIPYDESIRYPSVTADGLSMLYLCRAEPIEVDRTTIDENFARPRRAASPADWPALSNPLGAALSPDGLTAIFVRSRKSDTPGFTELWIVSRRSRGESFGSATVLGGEVNHPTKKNEMPSFLIDGSGLLFMQGGKLKASARRKDGAFDAPVDVNLPVPKDRRDLLYPCLLADGRTLYFSARATVADTPDFWQVRRERRVGVTNVPSFLSTVPPTPAPPPGNYALDFVGKGKFKNTMPFVVPGWNYLGDTPLTIEAWVTLRKPDFQLLLGNSKDDAGLNVQVNAGEWSFDFNAREDAIKHTTHIRSDEAARLDRRTHVAVTFDKSYLRMFIDGVEQQDFARPNQPYKPSPWPFTIGSASATDGKLVNGAQVVLDEVRISRVVRYNKNFTPAERHEPDADTEVLYHFDEGAGDTAHDASPYARHAKLESPTWVKTDGSAIPSP